MDTGGVRAIMVFDHDEHDMVTPRVVPPTEMPYFVYQLMPLKIEVLVEVDPVEMSLWGMTGES